jgi:hypothetical protein
MQAHPFQLVLNTNGNFLAKVAHLIISAKKNKNILLTSTHCLFRRYPRIFVNFVLVASPLNPSLRPHNHRPVHLTVTLNKKSNPKKVSSF